MAEKLLKAKKRNISKNVVGGTRSVASAASPRKVVLVGTYAGDQLKAWPGYYPYPLYGDDRIDAASAKKVNEIWLFKGTKEPRYFAAECLGVKTRDELKALGYPAKGKGHGDGTYLLFKIEKTYAPANASAALAASVESVIIRTKDFAKRSPKVAKQLKAYLESPDRNDPALANQLPSIVTKLPPQVLRVCEAAVQLNFFELIMPFQTTPTIVPSNRSYKVVDLFCGAGGFELGFEKAGYQIVFSTDFDPYCEMVHDKNRPNIPFLRKDIHDLDEQILHRYVPDSVDVLVGGPPCQGFSTIGKRISSDPLKRSQKDPRNTLFKEYIRVLKVLTPKFFLMENVVGLMTREKGLIFEEIKRSFAETGYRFHYLVLNAADFGVPQIRKRIFFFGSRVDVDIIPPSPTHAEFPDSLLQKWKTVGEAISDLADIPDDPKINHVSLKHGDVNVRRYMLIPEGGRMPEGALPPELYRRNFGNTFKRLDRARPSLTMVPGHNAFPIHPWLHRSLTVREAARIQTFPDNYIFMGGRQHQCMQVGNAVPPVLAEAWAQQIRKALDEYYEAKK